MSRKILKASVLGLGLLAGAVSTVTANIQAADIDPNNITDVYDTKATIDLSAGNLSLNSVPTIVFNSGTAGLANTLTAKTAGDLEVSNPGNEAGWSVTLDASAFVDSSKAVLLKGPVFHFPAGVVTEDSGGDVTMPTSHEVTDLMGMGAIEVLSAGSGEGLGTFTTKYNLDDITLKISSGNVSGEYKSTLNWTLTDAS
ncbi:WxL domain-containing protein [Lactobacillus terrae]|uniref:WxL domain-containing protein n=1 Tax=Lactobacillus terrae TaxID=2269374 RepID=UPI000C1B785C|nr:WxL domain-containing protein [Lactobacillus terrae]